MNLEELLSTLESPIVIRPTRRMTQGELESYLDKAADILRGWEAGAFELHFPRRFTLWMQLLRVLPNRLCFAAVRRVTQVSHP